MTYDMYKNLHMHQECVSLYQATNALRSMGENEAASRLEDSKWVELQDCYVYSAEREDLLEDLSKKKRWLVRQYSLDLQMDEQEYRHKLGLLEEQISAEERKPDRAPHVPKRVPKAFGGSLCCSRCFIDPMPERYFPEMSEETDV